MPTSLRYHEKGVVLASGGLDSTVLAHLLHAKRKLGGLFFVDYGQKSANAQWKVVYNMALRLRVASERCRLELPHYMQGSGHIISGVPARALKSRSEGMTLNERDMREVWDVLPGRNTLFLLFASGWALSLKLDTLYTGFHLDADGWELLAKSPGIGGDAGPAFANAYNAMVAAGGMWPNVFVRSPYLNAHWDKERIKATAKRLRVSGTYSCEFFPPCGGCQGCLDTA